ncbi:lipoprotein signal peptidase [Dietzia sp. UCD-THP]|uniref:signal peptidase II n=1 Tax=Dietzia sp. UCD-THP TaxID=1292020 RepID=UPI000362D106|nr:signal peptidase II [Dietzia sp. UCD-THP]EYT64347.1 lipoprotein signal peptidase [Dietzia sp. UCD-THP]
MTETNGTRADAAGTTPGGTGARYFRAGPAAMLVIAAVIVAVDQATKALAVWGLEGQDPIRIVGDSVRLLLLRNPGAAFSMGAGSTVVLSLVATVVVLGLLWFSRRVHSRWWAWGLGLILGGAAGNLVDRYVRAPGFLEGHVVDFVSVGWWPVFNVADSSLVIGVVVVAVAVFKGVEFDGSRGPAEKVTKDG